MPLSLRLNNLWIVVLLALLPTVATAQNTFPQKDGESVRYNIQIEFREAYISGLCILSKQNDTIASSIVNEFGISLIDFVDDNHKGTVRICHITQKLNRWYIKRIFTKDLKEVLTVMQSGGNEYIDKKYKLKYTFSLNDGFKE